MCAPSVPLLRIFLLWLSLSQKTPAAAQFTHHEPFTVTKGGCLICAPNCFCSPGYPDAYGRNEDCAIDVDWQGTLLVEHFETEANGDVLNVNGNEYSGTSSSSSPAAVQVAAGTTITFTSDSSSHYNGFKICLKTCSNTMGSAEITNRPCACGGEELRW